MEANTNPPKRRFQFTLLNLLLLMTTVAFGFGLYRARLDNISLAKANEDLAASNKRLKAERGGLTVEDKSKVYAINVPEMQSKAWTFRVYLPEGDEYFAALVVKDLPVLGTNPIRIDGNPPTSTTNKGIKVGDSFGDAVGLMPGEYLITFALFEQGNDWFYRLHVKLVSEKDGPFRSFSREIRCEDDEWPASKEFDISAISAISNKQVQTDLKKPSVLLDYRCGKEFASSTSNVGAIVWIDRVSNYDE